MNRFILTGAFAVAGLLAPAREATAAAIIYGVGVAPNTNVPTTFTVSQSSGDAAPVGPLGDPATAPFGLAASGGLLYTFDGATDTVRRVNPATGAYTGAPITIGIGNLNGEGDIAFSLDGATGYITAANNIGPAFTPTLYTFNLANGTSAVVGTTMDNIGPITVDGLAFNPANGLLYAITDADDRLYTLNPATGLLTGVGPLGVAPASGLGALTFDPDNGQLYAAINDGLYTVNTATGAATAVPPGGLGTDFGSVSGLAAVVPEPSSLALLGLATAGLCGRRKRRA